MEVLSQQCGNLASVGSNLGLNSSLYLCYYPGVPHHPKEGEQWDKQTNKKRHTTKLKNWQGMCTGKEKERNFKWLIYIGGDGHPLQY